MKTKSLFITATDTNVGKTLVCGLLLEYLLSKSVKAGYQKWVSTGDAHAPADLAECTRIAGLQPGKENLALQVPYCFSYPASPHLAAEIDSMEIDPDKIIQAHAEMVRKYELVIVEGVGGLMVPLRRDLLLADLLAQQQIPTIIVSRSGLGTLNHTFLTIEALRSRNIRITGIIFTDSAEEDETLVEDNIRTISEIGQVDVLGRLPYCRHKSELSGHFQKIGVKILPLFTS